MIPEVLGVHFVHLTERLHVGKIHRRFHDMIQRKTRLVKYGGEVLHDAIGLPGDSSVDELSGGGVDRNLARDEDPPSGDHSS